MCRFPFEQQTENNKYCCCLVLTTSTFKLCSQKTWRFLRPEFKMNIHQSFYAKEQLLRNLVKVSLK